LRLETERLILRPFEPGDAEELHAVHADPTTFAYIGSPPPSSIEETRARIERIRARLEDRISGPWAVVEKSSGRLIGDSGLQILEDGPEVELGYKLGREFRGRGFATEAGRAWVAYGFETLGLDRIVAVAWPENTASWRVMEKCGMTLVGPGHHYGHETVLYAITREEFEPPAG
jgi:ribosomal-protein-alanine N-acetyltransferase